MQIEELEEKKRENLEVLNQVLLRARRMERNT